MAGPRQETIAKYRLLIIDVYNLCRQGKEIDGLTLCVKHKVNKTAFSGLKKINVIAESEEKRVFRWLIGTGPGNENLFITLATKLANKLADIAMDRKNGLNKYRIKPVTLSNKPIPQIVTIVNKNDGLSELLLEERLERLKTSTSDEGSKSDKLMMEVTLTDARILLAVLGDNNNPLLRAFCNNFSKELVHRVY